MADCECLTGCIFFNNKMSNMPSMAAMYKKTYCRGDASHCARYLVFKALGKQAVPIDLFPNMTDRARALIENG